MAKDWHTVKEEIEAEIDRIWWEEPEEVTMSKRGIFPSGAGTDGQVLGNLFFLVANTQAMGWWTADPALKQALEDPTFTVEHCKRMWKYMTVHMLRQAPWFNLSKLNQYGMEIIDSLDSVKTKEELADLLWSWFNYVNCINRWFFLVFPWHLGMMFPLVTPDDVRELGLLAGLRWK